MKQLLFLSSLMMVGGIASLVHPFWGLLLYYMLALLRPDHLWDWALPGEYRWSLLAAIVVVLGCVLNLPKLVFRGTLNLTVCLILAYGTLLLFSCLFAYDPATSQSYLQQYGKVLFIALLASTVIDKLWHVRLMGAMILVTLGYVAWEINSRYLFDGRLDIFHHGFGGMDNNGAGLLLAMGIPFAYAWGVSAAKMWQRWVSWGLGLLILHAILMSYSRGAMLSTVVGVGWLLVHHRPRVQAAAITIVLCAALSLLAGKEIRERFASTTSFHQDDSAQSRLESWSAAWQITWDHPLLGQGIRNSMEYSQNYGADTFGRTIHSQYLQISADSGIPALLVYLALLVSGFINLRRARRACEEYLGEPNDLPRPADHVHMRQTALLSVSAQSSLLVFAFGGIFLSLEVFELPWLLLALAGLLPRVIERHVQHVAQAIATPTGDDPDTAKPSPAWPSRGRGRAKSGHRGAPAVRLHDRRGGFATS